MVSRVALCWSVLCQSRTIRRRVLSHFRKRNMPSMLVAGDVFSPACSPTFTLFFTIHRKGRGSMDHTSSLL